MGAFGITVDIYPIGELISAVANTREKRKKKKRKKKPSYIEAIGGLWVRVAIFTYYSIYIYITAQ